MQVAESSTGPTWFTCALCPPHCTYEAYNRRRGTGVPFRRVDRLVREAFYLPECVDERWRVCEPHYALAVSRKAASSEAKRNDSCPICLRTIHALWRPLTDDVRQAALETGVIGYQLPCKSANRLHNPTCCIECFERIHSVMQVQESGFLQSVPLTTATAVSGVVESAVLNKVGLDHRHKHLRFASLRCYIPCGTCSARSVGESTIFTQQKMPRLTPQQLQARSLFQMLPTSWILLCDPRSSNAPRSLTKSSAFFVAVSGIFTRHRTLRSSTSKHP
eukprot:3462422-Pyramimonas_sp.AAC.1